VDFSSEAPEACEPILQETFGFHPLAIADALHQSHIPKLDDWESYLYIVLYGIVFHRQDEDIETVELDVFLGSNYIVTHHDLPIQSLNQVWETCLHRERFLKRGSDHLLYRLADALVADYMQTVEEMDEDIEQIEDHVFTDPSTHIVQRIFTSNARPCISAELFLRCAVFNKLAGRICCRRCQRPDLFPRPV
jgi:magnesium transporter